MKISQKLVFIMKNQSCSSTGRVFEIEEVCTFSQFFLKIIYTHASLPGSMCAVCELFKPREASRAAQEADAGGALKKAPGAAPAAAQLATRPAAWPDWSQSPTRPRG